MNKKILILEDDKGLRSLLDFYLKRVGYKVSSLEDIEKLLIECEHFQPDLLLADFLLSDQRGVEIIMELNKDRQRYGNPRIFAISGKTDLSTAQEYLRLRKINHFLEKPFKLNTIVKEVQELLEPLDPSRVEKRSHHRYKFSHKIEYRLPGQENFRTGKCGNISYGGLMFSSKCLLVVGEILEIQFSLSKDPAISPNNTTARIIWIEDVHPKNPGEERNQIIGVCFLEITKQFIQDFKLFLEEQASEA